jgi:RNA polymerase sigma-70 factor (ECF subfamily)
LKVLGLGNGQTPDAIRDWGAYLRTMASRTAINRLRHRQKWRGDTTASRTEPVAESEEPEEPKGQEHRALVLEQAIAKLPRREAEVFSLRYIEDFTYEQIAAQMNLTINQVGVILHRARERLRKILLRLGVVPGE